jgi:hypothetical protein
MRTWTKILPFFIVEWLSRKHGEMFTISLYTGSFLIVTSPYKGIYFSVTEELDSK